MFFQLVRMGLSSLMQPHIVMSLIKWVSFYIKKCLMQLKKYRQLLQDIFCHLKTALLADKSYLLNPHFITLITVGVYFSPPFPCILSLWSCEALYSLTELT